MLNNQIDKMQWISKFEYENNNAICPLGEIVGKEIDPGDSNWSIARELTLKEREDFPSFTHIIKNPPTWKEYRYTYYYLASFKPPTSVEYRQIALAHAVALKVHNIDNGAHFIDAAAIIRAAKEFEAYLRGEN